MLYDYLICNYKSDEPIFVCDVDLPVTNVHLRQMFKVLCDSGKIRRFDNGIYYIPRQSDLKGGVPLTADMVAKYKYIERNENIEGYYSGYTFANQIGVTTQVLYVTEIVSNNASAAVREVNLNGQRLILRKAKYVVNKYNYRILQLLDLLKDIDQYADCGVKEMTSIINKYIADENIRKSDVDVYLSKYPDKIYKNIYEMKLYEVFA